MRPYQKRNLSKLYFVLIFFVYITTLIVINEGYVNRINNYIILKGQQFDQSITDITNTYEDFASFIFYNDIYVEDVVVLMQQASQATESEQAILRDTLHSKLVRTYNMAQNYNFSQIHFHLPNGDSFLRFHNVSEFGDSLIDSRPSIQMVIDQKRIITGFEGGKFMSGYRFIYPLFNDGSYVGSVELSVSGTNIVSELYKSMKDLDVALIIKDDIIETTRTYNLDVNHEYSLLSDEYLIEKENISIINKSSMSLQLIDDESFNQALKDKIGDNILVGQNFDTTLTYQNNDYIIHFKAIRDIGNKHVGYFYSVNKTNSLDLFARDRNQFILIATSIMMFMISLFYLVMKKEEEISKYAMIDSLTGIYNRGTFVDFAKRYIARQSRDKTPISIAMIDIDYFKEVNDIHGHRVGDKILVEIVQTIADSIRDTDILARYGGDEFIILLPDTDSDVALCVLERIRSHIEHTPFMKINSITISVGIHEKLNHESLDDAIQNADDALYKAKLNGRNRVIESKPSK
jgi:diguanylate cyclase (GGDEF)-like protein